MTARRLLTRLTRCCKITLPECAPNAPGVYVLFATRREKLYCLRVGTAGETGNVTLKTRIRAHYNSNPKNTVLARHMAADRELRARWNLDFRDRDARKRFLKSEGCFFLAVDMADTDARSLHDAEVTLEYHFRPRYRNRVGGDYGKIRKTLCPQQILASLRDDC